jgi:hypothetical protein
VIAAATFGNFMNPESVKDLPLIGYAHDGFGLLKNFLQTCRGQSSKEFDQVSIAHSISEASSGAGGQRGNSSSREVRKESGGGSGQQQQQKQQEEATPQKHHPKIG